MSEEQSTPSPAGEFVMFASGDGKVRVECRFENETLWLSQAMICELFDKAKATISGHIKNIFEEGELLENAVVRFYRTTASDGKNYLVQDEVSELNRVVTMWLDFAEDQARRRQQVFLRDWQSKLDQFLQFNDRDVLQGAGSISKKMADEKAQAEYGEFAEQQRRLKESEGANNIASLLQWQPSPKKSQ